MGVGLFVRITSGGLGVAGRDTASTRPLAARWVLPDELQDLATHPAPPRVNGVHEARARR
jgi:hypothetical protein